MSQNELIDIEVAFADITAVKVIPLQVPVGTTIEAAISLSGMRELFPAIDLQGGNRVGVFGQLKELKDVVQENDRIEIYRPIALNPREMRKQKVKKKK